MNLFDACEDVLEAARAILDSLIYDPDGVYVIVPDDALAGLREADRCLESLTVYQKTR
jgi:hypothetical protein